MAGAGLDVDTWDIPMGEVAAHPAYAAEIERRHALGVVGTLPGSGGGRSLILDGHVDVVPPGDPALWTHPPFAGVVMDGRLYGRGSVDMKGQRVAGLFALDALVRAGVTLKGDVHLFSVVGEEDGGMGTLASILRGYGADGAVVMEPTGLVVAPAQAGCLNFRVRIPGKAAHGAVREEGVSALEKLFPVYRALEELEAARAEMAAALAAAAERDPFLRDHPPALEWWGGRFLAARTDSGHPLVTSVQGAASAALGREVALEGMTYGADMGLLSSVAGIPTVLFGAGDVHRGHRPDEWVGVDELEAQARALAVAAMRLSTAALAVVLLVPGLAFAQAPEAVVAFDGESLGWEQYRLAGRGGPWLDALKASPVDGSVWAATHKVLIRFRGTHRDEFRNGDLQAELGAYCGDFKPLTFDAQGTLWLRLWCSGPDERSNLATFDGNTWRLLRPADQRAPDYALRPHLMAFGPGDVVWSATYFGLVRRQGDEWALFNPENSPLPHQQVSAIHVEPGGAVWVGTYGGHLARFDGTSWKVFRYTGPGAHGLQSAQMPHSLATALNGVLHFTYNHYGRVRRGAAEAFEAAPCPRDGQVPGYSEGVVFDGDGVLWVAHDSDHNPGVAGLFRWDGKTCRPILLPQNGSLLLAIDTSGNKWIATGSGHVVVYREGGVLLGG